MRMLCCAVLWEMEVEYPFYGNGFLNCKIRSRSMEEEGICHLCNRELVRLCELGKPSQQAPYPSSCPSCLMNYVIEKALSSSLSSAKGLSCLVALPIKYYDLILSLQTYFTVARHMSRDI